MEQRALIRFFTIKGLKAGAIHTELESVYGPEALALPTLKNWWACFHHGRTNLFEDFRSGRVLTNDLAGAIALMLAERRFSPCQMLCPHGRIGKATCLWILHDKPRLKNSIFAGCHMPYWATDEEKSVMFEILYDGTDRTEGGWLSTDYHQG